MTTSFSVLRIFRSLSVLLLMITFCSSFMAISEASTNFKYEYVYEAGERMQMIASPDGNVYLYQFDRNGNLLSRKNKSAPGVSSPDQINITNVSYDIYVFGVPQSATSVLFPTWTISNGQDDLVWVEGEKVTDSVWKATVRFSEHNYESGMYTTHIYIDSSLTYVVSTEVTPSVLTVQAPTDVHLNAGFYEIHIDGVSSHVAQFIFPTWTENNGQDDLIWLQGERTGETSWKISIPLNKYTNQTGNYITHLYAQDSYGNQIFLGVSTTTIHSYISTAQGNLDLVNHTTIAGWAWQPSVPNQAIYVHIYVDDQLIAVVKADKYRGDLLNAGKGNGYHGFVYQMNWSGYTEGVHTVYAYAVDGSGNNPHLGGSPKTYTLTLSKGTLDLVNSTTIAGWAWQPSTPNQPIDVHIYVDGQLKAVVRADQYRPDLQSAGIGNGSHGFSYQIDWSGYSVGTHIVNVFAVDGSGNNPVLNGSPKTYSIVP